MNISLPNLQKGVTENQVSTAVIFSNIKSCHILNPFQMQHYSIFFPLALKTVYHHIEEEKKPTLIRLCCLMNCFMTSSLVEMFSFLQKENRNCH